MQGDDVMIWARRTIAPPEWQDAQDQFENLFMKLGCPRQMMLVAVFGPAPDQTSLFASLPDAMLLTCLKGFESIGSCELPPEASLLIGHNDQFAKHFTYPKRITGI
jgi:hypothetical protein